MKKARVIGFFMVLLLFVSVLTFFEIRRFGSLTGFYTVENNIVDDEELRDAYRIVFGEVLFFIALFLILSLVLRFIFNHYAKKYNDTIDSEIERKTHLIPLDFKHPVTDDEEHNFK